MLEEHIQSIQKLCSGEKFNWFEIFDHLEQIKAQSPSVYKLVFADVLSQAVQKDQILRYVQFMNRAEVGVDPDDLKVSICGVEMAARFTGDVQANGDGTATVTLENIPIRDAIKPAYTPMPIARCITPEQHNYAFIIDDKDSVQEKAFYYQWFRSFFDHHIMQNQPSHIPWVDEVEINPHHHKITFYLEEGNEHLWRLICIEKNPRGPKHNRTRVGKFFL